MRRTGTQLRDTLHWPVWLVNRWHDRDVLRVFGLLGWRRHEASSHSLVRRVNIGSASRPFFAIKWANVLILYIAITYIAITLGELVQGEVVSSGMLLLLLIPTYGFAALLAWRNLGVLHSIVQPMTIASLLAVVIGGIALAGLTFLSMFAAADAGTLTKEGFGAVLSTVVMFAASAVVALVACVAILIARRSNIKALRVSAKALIDYLDSHLATNHRVTKVPPRSPRVGIFYLVLGFAYLAGIGFIPDEIFFSERFRSATNFVVLPGFAFLIYSRSYFQPDARHLLAADSRKPVLFLRSFVDDERSAHMRSAFALFDFSLESRLGSYFGQIGPFIAVGAPKDWTPQLGAARAELADDEWQATVLKWMDESRLILLMPGKTQWVEWELSQVVTNNHVDKLILLFPEVRRRFLFGIGLRKDANVRWEYVRAAFEGSKWSAALGDPVKRPEDIRAVIFRLDGTIDLITSRSRNRNSYHLAALVAHYLLLQGLREPRTG